MNWLLPFETKIFYLDFQWYSKSAPFGVRTIFYRLNNLVIESPLYCQEMYSKYSRHVQWFCVFYFEDSVSDAALCKITLSKWKTSRHKVFCNERCSVATLPFTQFSLFHGNISFSLKQPFIYPFLRQLCTILLSNIGNYKHC